MLHGRRKRAAIGLAMWHFALRTPPQRGEMLTAGRQLPATDVHLAQTCFLTTPYSRTSPWQAARACAVRLRRRASRWAQYTGWNVRGALRIAPGQAGINRDVRNYSGCPSTPRLPDKLARSMWCTRSEKRHAAEIVGVWCARENYADKQKIAPQSVSCIQSARCNI